MNENNWLKSWEPMSPVDNREYFRSRLLSIRVEGVSGLLRNLERSGFFESPCSTRFHGNYPGGLLDHSVNVLRVYEGFGLDVPSRSAVLACLLHDVCKVGLYVGVPGGYQCNSKIFKSGHGRRSLKILDLFLRLSPLEESMIRYHMGMYFCAESNPDAGEYSLRELVAAFRDPAVKFLYISDEIAAGRLDRKDG